MYKKVIQISKNPEAVIRCIGCNKVLESCLVYTGSIIQGVQFSTITQTINTPVLGVMETYDRSYVLGGHSIESQRKVGYFGRKKGSLCEECSALCRKTIKDKAGNLHQVVILDARPGYIGHTLEGDSLGKKKYRVLNTTVTGGK